MSGKKIKDNPSNSKLLSVVEGVRVLEQLYSSDPGFKEQYPGLESILKEFSDNAEGVDALHIPDQFNSLFSSLGWIAYESMSIDMARQAIRIGSDSGVAAAEIYLADYYDESCLGWATRGFHGNKAFSRRNRLIDLAKADYLEGRYHACVPLLLSLLDGIVNDVSKHVGFFAESTDLTAWDSVAAHSSGLQTLTTLLSKGRGRTSEEKITIPYRNGILHGRDLGYDNKIVAAKCWAALFAVKDWADAITAGKKDPKVEKEYSWDELSQRRVGLDNKKRQREEWRPRIVADFRYLPCVGFSNALPENTPEFTLAKFLDNWQGRKYGLMVGSLLHFQNEPEGKSAGRVREEYSKFDMRSFEILSVSDESPSVSRVNVKLDFDVGQSNVVVSVFYVDKDGYNSVRSCGDGQWLVLQASLVSILFSQE